MSSVSRSKESSTDDTKRRQAQAAAVVEGMLESKIGNPEYFGELLIKYSFKKGQITQVDIEDKATLK